MKRSLRTSRREFLRAGATALAGAALFSRGVGSARAMGDPRRRRKLVHRTLGRTGLRLPVVSVGSCYAVNLVRAALEEGFVYVHTSSDYADSNHERLLGKALRGLPRDSYVVATSPDLPYEFDRASGRSRDVGKRADPRRIAESLERSLERLGLDHVDIYYLPSVGSRGAALHEPYIEAFDRLKRDGRTRFTGITTHANEPEVIRAAVESEFWDVVLTAFNFRQPHREEVRAAIRQAAGAALGVVAMKTQAGVYWDRARTRKINMKAALKWVLQDENVHTAIPAFSNFEEMEEDLSVMEDPTMTPGEARDLELGDDLGYSGLYCEQCARCVPQCPAGLDIPTLMRSYMYAFGHGRPGKARDTLRYWSAGDVACVRCAECVVACTLGFDVKSRALDVARILEVPGEFLG